MKALSLSLQLSLLLVLLAGCTSETDTYCNRTCAKKALCVPGTDQTACTSDCQQSEQTVIPLIRADYIQAYLACVAPTPCETYETACETMARQMIKPSAAVQTFCMQYLPKAMACSITTYPDVATCVDRLEIYTDDAIAQAQACFPQSCDQLGFCVKSATVPP